MPNFLSRFLYPNISHRVTFNDNIIAAKSVIGEGWRAFIPSINTAQWRQMGNRNRKNCCRKMVLFSRDV